MTSLVASPKTSCYLCKGLEGQDAELASGIGVGGLAGSNCHVMPHSVREAPYPRQDSIPKNTANPYFHDSGNPYPHDLGPSHISYVHNEQSRAMIPMQRQGLPMAAGSPMRCTTPGARRGKLHVGEI